MIDKLKKDMGVDGRDRGVAKKAVALLFFGAIILVFVFMGTTPDQMGAAGGGVVAQVNKISISTSQLRDRVRNMEQRFGGGNASLQDFIRGQALESLIDREVIYQGVQKTGLHITDGEVRDIIVNIPAFQEDGRFQRSYYERYLKGSRQAAGKFEMEIRKDAASNRLRTAIETALPPVTAELARENEVKKARAEVEFVAFSESDLGEKEADRLKSFPKTEEFSKQVSDYYERNKTEFQIKEETHAQHILVKFKAGDAADEQRAKKKIEEVALRAKSEDFAKLAKEISEDAGSKGNGGDLGFFGRGQMVKPFEDKAFSMDVGSISEPVKSQFGYHLIKVLEKKEAKQKSLEEVRSQISKKLHAGAKVKEEVEFLKKDLLAGKAKELRTFVKRHGLKWQSSGEFDLSASRVPKIGANEELIKESFRLGEKETSKKVFLVDGRSYIIRHKSVKAKKAEVEPSNEELVSSLNQDKTYDVLRQLRDGWKKSSEIQRRL